MNINPDRLKNTLKRHEGEVLHAYQDSEGYWTIGVGRLIDKRLGGGLTKQESDYLLDNDIHRKMEELLKSYPTVASLDGVRQEVLINMAFNMGIPRLSGFKKMWEAINKNDFPTAANEMLDSKWAQQVGLRSAELSQAMRTGKLQSIR